MEAEPGEWTFRYRVDSEDKVVEVSPNWTEFARTNDAPESCLPGGIVERSLWDFIADKETKELYRLLIERVRRTGKSAEVRFRCDAPECRRFMEITLDRKEGEVVEFTSRIVRVEPRDAVPLLDVRQVRSEEFLTICSYCKRIWVGDEGWLEAEEAIQRLNLFQSSRLPQLTHGVCTDCYEAVMAQLEA